MAIETTRRRLASTICCLASMSPRSMRLASETSCSAVSSGTRADRAQVQAQRVEARLDREVDLRLLRRVVGVAAAGAPRRRPRPSAASRRRRACRRRRRRRCPARRGSACSSCTCSFVTSTSSRRSAICSNVRKPRSWPSAMSGRSSSSSDDRRLVRQQHFGLGRSRPAPRDLSTPTRAPSPGRRSSLCRNVRDIVAMAEPELSSFGGAQPGGVIAQDRVRMAAPRSLASPEVAMRAVALRQPDVQAAAPDAPRLASRASASPGVEKVIRIGQTGASSSSRARARVLRRPRPAPEGRAHVALRGGRQRRDRRGRPRRGGASRPRRSRERIAELVRERQDALRAEVTIAARYPEHKPAPVSRHPDAGDLHAATARRSPRERGTRRLVGVAAQGMTACPCAQQLVAGARARAPARRRLHRRRDRAHPRRTSPSRPTTSAASDAPHRLPRGLRRRDRRARRCSTIVEGSMSSEIYELMKRSDEGAVVEKAHRRPRFVEDCVREMIGGVVERFAELADAHVRLGPPGEPRDDPPAQRRRRALRPARRAAPRARDAASTLAHHTLDARVARARAAR